MAHVGLLILSRLNPLDLAQFDLQGVEALRHVAEVLHSGGRQGLDEAFEPLEPSLHTLMLPVKAAEVLL